MRHWGRVGIEKSKIGQASNALCVTLVSESSTEHCVRFPDSIKIGVDGAVSVGVTLQAEPWQEVHRGGCVEQASVLLDVDDLSVGKVTGTTQHVEQCSSRTPGELVSERVVRALRSREAATEGDEGLHFSGSFVDVVETLHCKEVIDARINSTLVDNGDTGIHSSLVLCLDPVTEVRCGDHVCSGCNRHFGNLGMESPGEKADNHIVRLDQVFQVLRAFLYVKKHRFCPQMGFCDRVCLRLDGSSNGNTKTRVPGEVFHNRSTHIPGTKDQGLSVRGEVPTHNLHSLFSAQLRDVFIFWSEFSIAGDDCSSHDVANLGPLHLVERLRGVVSHNVLNVGA